MTENDPETKRRGFAEILAAMPNIGQDTDFERIRSTVQSLPVEHLAADILEQ